MTTPIVHVPAVPTELDDAFWSARGRAIQAYASVEQSLCRVFSYLSGMPFDVASIIFFKIVNAGTLHGMMEKMLKKKHKNTYSLFWNSFQKILKNELTERRNHIVHWNAVTALDGGGHTLKLMPADFANYNFRESDPSPIVTSDLLEFIEKCNFFARLLSTFDMVHQTEVTQHLDTAQLQAWREIFLQPVIYPPPSTHPLCQKQPTPGNQPPPSPA